MPFATTIAAVFAAFGVNADENIILAILVGGTAVVTGVISIIQANSEQTK